MSTTTALATFAGSLLLSIVSGAVLGERIEQLGTRLGFTEAFLGILTALGADAPEISSAVTALHRGQHDLGLAIVFGSSVFNLAAVLGLSAVVAGGVVIGRGALALNGGVAAALSATVAAQLLGWLSPPIAAILIGAAFVPYVVLSALRPQQVAALGLPFAVTEAVAEADRAARHDATPRHATAIDVLTLAPSVVAIVVASVWMVDAASLLGARWRVPPVLVGMVVIATMTSVPNVVSAIRLARRGRGSAVVSEAFTSNSLNLIAGVSIPALAMTVIVATPVAQFAAVWLVVMSIVAIAISYKCGLTRVGGAVLIVIYLAFLGAVIWARGS
ncbi:MAG: hypothetical protein M3082_05830 [Candidatus Dormibacteraeota bacterium]|nr:hypothetical protein [Candidatus Dormibacteraeota bacterium]